jgi:hypothetical protein
MWGLMGPPMGRLCPGRQLDYKRPLHAANAAQVVGLLEVFLTSEHVCIVME